MGERIQRGETSGKKGRRGFESETTTTESRAEKKKNRNLYWAMFLPVFLLCFGVYDKCHEDKPKGVAYSSSDEHPEKDAGSEPDADLKEAWDLVRKDLGTDGVGRIYRFGVDSQAKGKDAVEAAVALAEYLSEGHYKPSDNQADFSPEFRDRLEELRGRRVRGLDDALSAIQDNADMIDNGLGVVNVGDDEGQTLPNFDGKGGIVECEDGIHAIYRRGGSRFDQMVRVTNEVQREIDEGGREFLAVEASEKQPVLSLSLCTQKYARESLPDDADDDEVGLVGADFFGDFVWRGSFLYYYPPEFLVDEGLIDGELVIYDEYQLVTILREVYLLSVDDLSRRIDRTETWVIQRRVSELLSSESIYWLEKGEGYESQYNRVGDLFDDFSSLSVALEAGNITPEEFVEQATQIETAVRAMRRRR